MDEGGAPAPLAIKAASVLGPIEPVPGKREDTWNWRMAARVRGPRRPSMARPAS